MCDNKEFDKPFVFYSNKSISYISILFFVTIIAAGFYFLSFEKDLVLIGAPIVLVFVWLHLANIFNRKPRLIINKSGIDICWLGVGFIDIRDVISVEYTNSKNGEQMSLNLRNPELYMGKMKLHIKLNYKLCTSFGVSGFYINISNLNCDKIFLRNAVKCMHDESF